MPVSSINLPLANKWLDSNLYRSWEPEVADVESLFDVHIVTNTDEVMVPIRQSGRMMDMGDGTVPIQTIVKSNRTLKGAVKVYREALGKFEKIELLPDVLKEMQAEGIAAAKREMLATALRTLNAGVTNDLTGTPAAPSADTTLLPLAKYLLSGSGGSGEMVLIMQAADKLQLFSDTKLASSDFVNGKPYQMGASRINSTYEFSKIYGHPQTEEFVWPALTTPNRRDVFAFFKKAVRLYCWQKPMMEVIYDKMTKRYFVDCDMYCGAMLVEPNHAARIKVLT